LHRGRASSATVPGLRNEDGHAIANIDTTVMLERPKLAAHFDAMRRALAGALGIDPDAVNIKAKTQEGIRQLERLMMERITHLEAAASEYERLKEEWEEIRAEHMAIHHAARTHQLDRPPCLECGKDHPTSEHAENA
jgi:hypothetical protein